MANFNPFLKLAEYLGGESQPLRLNLFDLHLRRLFYCLKNDMAIDY